MAEDVNQSSREQHQRRIIHIDMDAFFASVEQRDNPTLRGKPVIVGGQPNSRGVVAACSYEARQFGIHSAMPCAHAARLCADAIYIKPNIAKYREVSQQIHAIFQRFTDIIEPLSLDEAYLDVSDDLEPATAIAKAIKVTIHTELNLVASAGVSYNKFLAKLASDMDKPDGLCVIRPHQAQAIINPLAIRKFHGIGPATEKRMQALGIKTGADLRQKSLTELQKQFKNSAQYYFNIARGIDDRAVKTERKRVTIGRETTFAENLTDENAITQVLLRLGQQLQPELEKKQLQAFTLTIKIKFADFTQITRSKTETAPINLSDTATLQSLLRFLLQQGELRQRPVRLVGVSLAKLSAVGTASPMRQLDLPGKGFER